MPYISQMQRTYLWPTSDLDASNPGELNYQITYLVETYLRNRGESYSTYNDLIGVLECAKMELYRRMVVPYEDTKIEENGDVY